MDRVREKIKLYDVPRRTNIVIAEENPRIPPASLQLVKGQKLLFDHLDGMYSLCYDKDNNIVHLAGWTEVYIVDDE